ncbi:MAG: 50S ribosomal protein L13 [Candidatus Thermoplasmatota archaeon]|nr:50S ribosomal protein L13 [Candidatus Thermoplasmatota archaeon]
MPQVIDATGLILGRLSSSVARTLLNDEKREIAIVNAEKCIVSGSRKRLMTQFLDRMELNHPRKGPHYPRMPDKIIKRTIRGMLPYQQQRGRDALKRVKVYIGVPSEFKSSKMDTCEDAKNKGLEYYLELGEISRILGVNLKGV